MTDTKNYQRMLNWDVIYRENATLFPPALAREKKAGKKSVALVTMPLLMVNPDSKCFPDRVGLPKHVVRHEGGGGDMEFIVAAADEYLQYWLMNMQNRERLHRYGEPKDTFVFASLEEQKEYLMACNQLAGVGSNRRDQVFLSLPGPVLAHHSHQRERAAGVTHQL